MSNKPLILDCTLRDGGYYTNWDFDQELVKDYFIAMEKLPVEYLEIGYRSKPMKGYLGEFFYCPKYIFEKARRLAPSKKITIILNEKDCQPTDVDYLFDGLNEYIDLVRIAVNPDRFDYAIELAKSIKSAGFSVAFNVMYMSKWIKDKVFLEKIHKVNGLVDFFYMVDSFGSVYPDQVKELVNILKQKIDVPLGFHGHNNLELAHINTLTAIEEGCEIVDATITGMGRGAGNLKTELLLTSMASNYSLEISFNELSVIVSDFEKMQKQYGWGTNLPYMFSGANSLPQKEVMEWMGLNRYPLGSMLTALKNQRDEISDNIGLPKFKVEKKFEKVVIVGGGVSINNQLEIIKRFLKILGDVCIIHAGVRYSKLLSDLKVLEQYYCLVGSEALKLKREFNDLTSLNGKCIFPPFPRQMGTVLPNEIKEVSYELEDLSFTNKFEDSPLAIALQLGLNLSNKEIILVGFDGYESSKDKVQFQLANENQYLIDRMLANNVEISSATKTNYKNIAEKSLFSYFK